MLAKGVVAHVLGRGTLEEMAGMAGEGVVLRFALIRNTESG